MLLLCVIDYYFWLSRPVHVSNLHYFYALSLYMCCCIHLQMYDNIAALRFDTGMNGEMVANALVSAEGEVMELKQPVPAEGRVEDWMTGVLLEMRRTNRLITKEAIYFYSHQKTR